MAVGWTLTKGLEVCYRNHHYTVGGQIFCQADGGPQGVKASVEASENYMLQIDSKLLGALEGQGIQVSEYRR